MMGWLEDIIESLPGELEELARLYLPVISRMTRQEVLAWMDKLRTGRDMQSGIAKKMTTSELIASQEKSNEALKALNKDNAVQYELGWHILWMLVSIGLDKIED